MGSEMCIRDRWGGGGDKQKNQKRLCLVCSTVSVLEFQTYNKGSFTLTLLSLGIQGVDHMKC